MFRFLHTADLHLDSPMLGLASRDGAGDELRSAVRRAFVRLIDLALDQAVDFVVIAGDVYDRDGKDYQTALFFRSQMNRLKDRGIPAFLIAGNHDAASVISRKLTLPGNVHQFPSKAPQTVELPVLPVALHGMSFPDRAVDENLVPRYPKPVVGKFNLGILHTSLSGAQGHDTYAPCTLADLTGKGYDYWALGHIHQPAVLHRDPWIVYPGNLQGRHVREPGERGCVIVEVSDDLHVTACVSHHLDVLRWAVVTIDLTGAEDFEQAVAMVRAGVREAADAADGRTLAVRVELTGATPLHRQLSSRPDQMAAEVQAIADEYGEGAVWVEQVIVSTRAMIDLETLAASEPLTKVVIEAVREAEDIELPPEVLAMLDILPPDLKEELEAAWSGEGRKKILDDACSIVLDRLTTKGGAR